MCHEASMSSTKQDIRDDMKEMRWAAIDSCHMMIKLGEPASCEE